MQKFVTIFYTSLYCYKSNKNKDSKTTSKTSNPIFISFAYTFVKL